MKENKKERHRERPRESSPRHGGGEGGREGVSVFPARAFPSAYYDHTHAKSLLHLPFSLKPSASSFTFPSVSPRPRFEPNSCVVAVTMLHAVAFFCFWFFFALFGGDFALRVVRGCLFLMFSGKLRWYRTIGCYGILCKTVKLIYHRSGTFWQRLPSRVKIICIYSSASSDFFYYLRMSSVRFYK